jgi:Domain of unknown function (DUF4384)
MRLPGIPLSAGGRSRTFVTTASFRGEKGSRMRMSNAISRAMIAAALIGLTGGGMTAFAQTGQETESPLARDLTVAQKPLHQLTSGAGMDVEAWVDNPSLTYAIGQPMRVMVRPRQDAHITVVNVDAGGRVAVLYPNHFQRDTHVRAGSIVMIPHEGASWRFNVTGPAGVDLFKIFASRKPLSLPELDQLIRASEKSPLVTLGRSADDVARDLVAQLRPDAAGPDQQAIVRNILVRIVAQAPPAVSAAPAFTVRTERPVYRVGEKVQISVTAHRDCRLTLVSVGASGNAVQLYPNPFQPDDPLIRTGQWIEIPRPLSPLEIVARAPAGIEAILAICRDASTPARPQKAVQGGLALLGTLQAFGRDLIASAAGQDPARPENSSTSYLVVE